MQNQIMQIDSIQPPDVRRPAKPTSWPHWVKLRLDNSTLKEQRDRSGAFRTVQVLPAALMLTEPQRMAIEHYGRSVDLLLQQTPEQDIRFGQRTLAVVSKLLVTLAGREGGALSATAKGEAYMAVLDDVPCWAVEEAARVWYRGECGQLHNYTWPPAPAILRDIARRAECDLRWRATNLQRLLSAEEEKSLSDEHRAMMQNRLGSLIAEAQPLRSDQSRTSQSRRQPTHDELRPTRTVEA